MIEDEEFNISMMMQLLKKAGVDPESRVDYALHGQEAVDLVAQQPFHYKLIFSDFNMPIMDGIEATKRIREIYKA
jgi:CheY-like chemotaxis protein